MVLHGTIALVYRSHLNNNEYNYVYICFSLNVKPIYDSLLKGSTMVLNTTKVIMNLQHVCNYNSHYTESSDYNA